jgi:UDP-hydrolysing UDP-N-acetyl-D-glucosamine 2-epimerase
MGEEPWRVFNTGAPGIECLRKTVLLPKEMLERQLGVSLGDLTFLVTFHPATSEGEDPARQLDELLAALEAFPSASLIFTAPNADAGGDRLAARLREYVAAHADRARFFASLGQQKYLSLLHHVQAVVGNSSSGIIEAPSAGCATVNIGSRQRGRLRAASVIDCEVKRESIVEAIRRALDPEFRNRLSAVVNPYGDGNVSEKILGVLRQYAGRRLIPKAFFDLSGELRE